MTVGLQTNEHLDPAVINRVANAGTSCLKYEQGSAGTASTSYTSAPSSGFVAGGTFVAPPTGQVKIFWGAGLFLGTVGGSGWCSYEVRAGGVIGSGTQVVLPDDSRACRIKVNSTTNNDQQWGQGDLVTGLTPGNTYNARLSYKAAGGTISISAQRIMIDPAH